MKFVRRAVPIVVLLLVLSLLLGQAVVAGRPPKGEVKTVAFEGDIVGENGLTVESKRDSVTVYGPTEGSIELCLEDEKWGDFAGSHHGGVKIILERGAATIYFGFDHYLNPEVQAYVPAYSLEGFGTYSLEAGVCKITLQDTNIYVVEAHRTGKGKGSGFGLEFTDPTPISDVSFDMTIGS